MPEYEITLSRRETFVTVFTIEAADRKAARAFAERVCNDRDLEMEHVYSWEPVAAQVPAVRSVRRYAPAPASADQ